MVDLLRIVHHGRLARQVQPLVAQLFHRLAPGDPPPSSLQSGGLDIGVVPLTARIPGRVAVRAQEVDARQSCITRHLLPQRDGGGGVGQVAGLVDLEHRLAVHAQVAGVLEGAQHALEMRLVVGTPGVKLLDQHLVRQAVPHARPRLVGPAQHEGKVGLARLQHLFERALEQAPPVAEPVVVVAERVDAMGPGQLGLGGAGLWHAQVVETQVGRQVGLPVSAVQGHGLGHVRPFREALAPPPVVFGNGVVLGQVDGDDGGAWHGGSGWRLCFAPTLKCRGRGWASWRIGELARWRMPNAEWQFATGNFQLAREDKGPAQPVRPVLRAVLHGRRGMPTAGHHTSPQRREVWHWSGPGRVRTRGRIV